MGAVPKVVGLKTLQRHLHQTQRALEQARATITTLEAQRHELAKENELLRAELDRYRKLLDERAPHRPERVAPNTLQLAFAEVVQTLGADLLQANDAATADPLSTTPPLSPPAQPPRNPPRPRHRHGRRALDLSKLPVETVIVTPEEVRVAEGVGFERIGAETSARLAFRPGAFLHLRVVREKYKRVERVVSPDPTPSNVPVDATVAQGDVNAIEAPEPDTQIVIAPVPDSLWPGLMADASAIAHHMVAKYDDLLPLHRQQGISARHGFEIPRSTQAGWLRAVHTFMSKVVTAMIAEAERTAHCIATDATGVRVRVRGQRECATWHVFVLLADQDHIVFKYSPTHDAPTARAMVGAFKGYLHVDAASIYESLFLERRLIEVACWAHLRRYVWKSLASEPHRATAWLAIIAQLYEVHRATLALPLPARTYERARQAAPILDLMEAWLVRETPTVEPRTPLRAAVTYYQNQKLALHRFLEDGSLRLDNNRAEGSLRRLVLGQENWVRFQNEVGVQWFCTFRSLIASCHLHALNPEIYVEQLLRLLPHWPHRRVLELSPRYWGQTLRQMTDAQRQILTPSWGNATTPDAAVRRPPVIALTG